MISIIILVPNKKSLLSEKIFKLSKTIFIEIGMKYSGLGVVLAKENYVNTSTAIPSAISSLVHSIYGSIFVSIFKEHKKQD